MTNFEIVEQHGSHCVYGIKPINMDIETVADIKNLLGIYSKNSRNSEVLLQLLMVIKQYNDFAKNSPGSDERTAILNEWDIITNAAEELLGEYL